MILPQGLSSNYRLNVNKHISQKRTAASITVLVNIFIKTFLQVTCYFEKNALSIIFLTIIMFNKTFVEVTVLISDAPDTVTTGL